MASAASPLPSPEGTGVVAGLLGLCGFLGGAAGSGFFAAGGLGGLHIGLDGAQERVDFGGGGGLSHGLVDGRADFGDGFGGQFFAATTERLLQVFERDFSVCHNSIVIGVIIQVCQVIAANKVSNCSLYKESTSLIHINRSH